MTSYARDFRQALRALARAPGFAVVTVLTLALGIGATTMLFSTVYGVLLKPLPYPDSHEIVRVLEIHEGGRQQTRMSDPNFLDLSESPRLDSLAQYQSSLVSMIGGGEPARVVAAEVSPEFFSVMGVQPQIGRPILEQDARGGEAVAVVSHHYWRRYLGGDQELSTLELIYREERVSVVGVMPPAFHFPDHADIWVPRQVQQLSPSRTALNRTAIGRVAEGTSLESAEQDLSTIARRLHQQFGSDTRMVDASLVPLHEMQVGHTRTPLLLLLGAAAFLLLIAGANVVNLLMARLASRQREIAVRLALGAKRLRLIQQFLVESSILTLLGGVLGALLAHWGLGILRGVGPDDLPRLADIRISGVVLAFCLGVALVLAIGLALLTAWRATRYGSLSNLAASQRTQSGQSDQRLRGTLVVSQIALTLVLLIGTGLLLRSLAQVQGTDPGYRTAGGLVLNCHLPFPSTDAARAEQRQFHRRLIDRLAALPGVEAVGGIDTLPLKQQGGNGTFLLLNQPDEVTDWAGFEAVSKIPGRTGSAEFRRATPEYFDAMEIELLQGRLFDERDQPETTHAAIVSESLAKATWPGEDPIGQWIQFGNMDGELRPFSVVGVVSDLRETNLETEPKHTVYANVWQRARGFRGAFDLVIATDGESTPLIPTVRTTVRELAPQAAPSLLTLEEILADSTATRRFQLLLLGVFGGLALLLASVGVFGVMSLNVAQRRQEIGVRLALGASGGSVVQSVLRRGLRMAAIGIVLGLIGAFALSRLMTGLVYGVTATDPITFAVIPLLLLATTGLACVLPAYRAARIDPMVTLRAD